MLVDIISDALGLNNMGSEQLSSGKTNDALRSYQSALKLLKRFASLDESNRCEGKADGEESEQERTLRFSLSTGDDDGFQCSVPNLQQDDGPYIFDRAICFDCDPDGEEIDSSNLGLLFATVAFNVAITCHVKARTRNSGKYISRAMDMYEFCSAKLLQYQRQRKQQKHELPSHSSLILSLLCKNNMAQLMYVDCCDYVNGVEMMNQASAILSSMYHEQRQQQQQANETTTKTSSSLLLAFAYDIDDDSDESWSCDLVLGSDIEGIVLNRMQMRCVPSGAMAA